ncbi:MAG TPA: hypothetical protein VIJ43_15605 [Burkholderiales bacterium]
MRTPHAKSSARPGSDQNSSAAKRQPKIAAAAGYGVERRGFLGDEALGDWLEAEAEVEHLLELRPGDEPKTSAKQGFQQELEAQLKEWDAKLEALKAKARDAKAEIRAEFAVELEALAGERAVAQEKLQELRRHGEWAWEDLKDSAEKTWSELREAIERSASSFK